MDRDAELNEMLDRMAIDKVCATYTIELDRGRIDQMIEAFAEDGVLEIPTFIAVGRAGIKKALGGTRASHSPEALKARGETAAKRIVRHHLTSRRVLFEGPDEAKGRTYWLNLTEIGPDHSGLYNDRYRRIDGRWYIAHRDIRVDWVAHNSRMASQDSVGDRPEGYVKQRITG
jgi:hypothetical protein